jgi:hypothetical protein
MRCIAATISDKTQTFLFETKTTVFVPYRKQPFGEDIRSRQCRPWPARPCCTMPSMTGLGKPHRGVGTLSTGGYGLITAIRRRLPQERLAALPKGSFEPPLPFFC